MTFGIMNIDGKKITKIKRPMNINLTLFSQKNHLFDLYLVADNCIA